MGFYLQTLREEEEFMGNTGFDSDGIATPGDKYEVELSDVAQTIEDINADYADQSSQEELDGQDAGLEENPVEECMIAMAECEYNWNAIMRAIGTREIQEASRGREMVMEAVDIKGFFNKIKEFFVKLFKKFTAIVKNWIDNASAAFRTNKSFIAKYGKDLEKGQNAYFAKSDYKNFKGYTFEGLGTNVKGLAAIFSNPNISNDRLKAHAEKLMSSVRDGNFDANVQTGMHPDTYRGHLVKAIDSKKPDKVEAGDFNKMLKEAIYGSSEKVTLKKGDSIISAGTIKTILSSDKSDINAVKEAYGKAKKLFDETIKALTDLEKSINRSTAEASDNKSKMMSGVTKLCTWEKEKKSALVMANSTLMKAIRAQKAQSRKVANAYIFALNRDTKQKAFDRADGKTVKESGFLAGVELI